MPAKLAHSSTNVPILNALKLDTWCDAKCHSSFEPVIRAIVQTVFMRHKVRQVGKSVSQSVNPLCVPCSVFFFFGGNLNSSNDFDYVIHVIMKNSKRLRFFQLTLIDGSIVFETGWKGGCWFTEGQLGSFGGDRWDLGTFWIAFRDHEAYSDLSSWT